MAVQESDEQYPKPQTQYMCPRLVTARYRAYTDGVAYKQFEQLCHGTLLDRYWVVVPAKCVIVKGSGSGDLRLWKVFSNQGDKQKVYAIDKIYIPRGQNLRVDETLNHEVAFMRLQEPNFDYVAGEPGSCRWVDFVTPEERSTNSNDMRPFDDSKYWYDMDEDKTYARKHGKTDTYTESNTDNYAKGYYEDNSSARKVENTESNTESTNDDYAKGYYEDTSNTGKGGNSEDLTRKLYPGCPLNNNQLGQVSWSFMHAVAAHYPEHPSQLEQHRMRQYMELFAVFYPFPCDECAIAYRKSMEKNPPDASSRDKLSQWLCNIHNEAKFRDSHGENPPFDCSRVDERWRVGWKDGSCEKNDINKFRGD